MNPVNIGSTNPHFQVTHGKEPAHAKAAKQKDKEAFQSSLKSALADDDAAEKLEGSPKDTKEAKDADEKKDEKRTKKAPPQPEDVAAALAFAAQQPLPKAEPTAEIPADAQLDLLADPKLASKGAPLAPTAGPELVDAQGTKPALPAAESLAATAEPTDAADAAPVLAPVELGAAPKPAETPASASEPVTELAPGPAKASEPATATPTASAPATPPTAAQAETTAQVAATAQPAQAQATPPKPTAKVEPKPSKAEPVRGATKASPAHAPQSATSTTTEAPGAPQTRPLDPVGRPADVDAKDAQAPKQGAHHGKPSLAEVTAEKKAKTGALDADMAADAARVSASVADPSFAAPTPILTETAKTVTASAPAAGNTENTVRGLTEVDAKTEARIGAAEAAGHKRTLASGEARGQIVTAELGRVEVVAHAAAHESARVDVHVRAVEDHAKQAIAAAAESLREHVRVEVPNAAVHVERSHNDLLGNGTSARDFSGQSASGNDGGSGESGRGGRQDGAVGAHDASVKTPAVSARGARVRYVL